VCSWVVGQVYLYYIENGCEDMAGFMRHSSIYGLKWGNWVVLRPILPAMTTKVSY
jgi:hypothetical protein